MQCELCGGLCGEAFKVVVEGGTVVACPQCARLGRVVEKVTVRRPEKPKTAVSEAPHPAEEFEASEGFEVSDDFADKIRKARERLGLKQGELAKAVNEPESLIQRIESGKIVPSPSVAQRLERRLEISLRDKGDKASVLLPRKPSEGPVTLGDIIVVRKRKA